MLTLKEKNDSLQKLQQKLVELSKNAEEMQLNENRILGEKLREKSERYEAAFQKARRDLEDKVKALRIQQESLEEQVKEEMKKQSSEKESLLQKMGFLQNSIKSHKESFNREHMLALKKLNTEKETVLQEKKSKVEESLLGAIKDLESRIVLQDKSLKMEREKKQELIEEKTDQVESFKSALESNYLKKMEMVEADVRKKTEEFEREIKDCETANQKLEQEIND